MSRTNRRPYRGSRAIDPSCRSHGDCPWCRGKRTYKVKRIVPDDAADQELMARVKREMDEETARWLAVVVTSGDVFKGSQAS